MESAAEKRREARRRKILMNQEDRMKKIMGVPEVAEKQPDINGDIAYISRDDVSNHSKAEETTNTNDLKSTEISDNQDYTNLKNIINTDDTNEDSWLLGQTKHTTIRKRNATDIKDNSSHIHDNISSQFHERLGGNQITETRDDPANLREEIISRSFVKIRFLICLVVGALVRVSMMYSFGRNYVQTSVYPFVALQIAIVGYQKGTNMEICEAWSGGLYMVALQMAGINSQVLHTCKLVIGFIIVIAGDFAAFAFMFIITHVLMT